MIEGASFGGRRVVRSMQKLLSASLLSALLLLVALLFSASLRAEEGDAPPEPIRVAFSYQAPTACMNEEQAFSLVHRRSQRLVRAFDDSAHEHLHMRVVPSASGYSGVLIVDRAGQQERRSMTGESCDEVVEALALTAALSIDPSATLTLGPAEPTKPRSSDFPTPEREEEGDSNSDPVKTAPSEGIESPPGDVVFTLGPSVNVARLMNHTTHLGAGLVFGLRREGGRVWLPLDARVTFDFLAEAGGGDEARIVTRFIVAKVAYCALRWGRAASLSLCPLSQLGVVMGRAQGFEQETGTTRSFFSLGLEAWLKAQIAARAELWLSPAVLFPLTKRTFVVEPGPEILVETLNVGGGISAGISFRF